MTIKTKCPNPACSVRYNLPDEKLGKNVTCGKCQTRFVVTAQEENWPEAQSPAKNRPPIVSVGKNMAGPIVKKIDPPAPAVRVEPAPVPRPQRAPAVREAKVAPRPKRQQQNDEIPQVAWDHRSRFRSRLLIAGLILVLILAVAAVPAYFLWFNDQLQTERFAGIEITSTAVTVVVIEITPDAKWKYDYSVLFKKTHETNLGKSFGDDNLFEPEGLEVTKVAVQRFHKEVCDEFSLKPEQIVIVGGGGIFKALDNRKLEKKEKANLIAKNKSILEESIGKPLNCPIQFVEVKSEIEMILKTLVKNILLDQTILIQIKSSSCRGAIYHTENGQYTHLKETMGVEDFQEMAATHAKEKGIDFAAAAKDLATKKIGEPLKAALKKQPALARRTRIHLTGWTPWVVATYTNPAGRAEMYTPLRLSKINDLYKEACEKTTWPVFHCPSELQNPLRQQVESETKKMQQQWSEKKLIAGMGILLAFAEEMNFDSKKVYFNDYGDFSLPISVILERWQKKRGR